MMNLDERMFIGEAEERRLRQSPLDRQRGIERQREKEKHLVPLAIDRRTVIMVTPDKCNEAYAEAFRRRRSGGGGTRLTTVSRSLTEYIL